MILQLTGQNRDGKKVWRAYNTFPMWSVGKPEERTGYLIVSRTGKHANFVLDEYPAWLPAERKRELTVQLSFANSWQGVENTIKNVLKLDGPVLLPEELKQQQAAFKERQTRELIDWAEKIISLCVPHDPTGQNGRDPWLTAVAKWKRGENITG